jgi:sulfite exporter TauE/SafE
MSSNAIAFFIGLFGSVHCVGMCGPLALAVPSFRNKWWLVVADKVLYNTGRIVVYSLLGFLIGLIGKQLWLLGLQQGISLISGGLIIMAGISRLYKIRLAKNNFLSSILLPFNKLITYALKHNVGHFFIGMLNGLLPCGFVYLALVGAINTSSLQTAAAYMFWFGMGTFPLMLMAMVGSGFAGPAVRRYINRGIPYVMICLGFWFVVRGMNLNLPYLSPAKQTTGVSMCR